MMADIQADFDLDYTLEGTLTAAPDYGMVLGCLVAIVAFRTCPARLVLQAVFGSIAVVCLVCAWHPTWTTLLMARAVGGLAWSQAATHFPVWIDRHGPSPHKTLWLACTNLSILAGVLAGYLAGGLIRATRANITWVELYAVEGILMATCAIWFHLAFDPELISMDMEHHNHNPHHDDNTSTRPNSSHSNGNGHNGHNGTQLLSSEELSIRQVVQALMGSPPFVFAVALSGCISGGIVFSLYFGTQVSEARGMSAMTTLSMVMLVFVTAPGPGILVGSWIVNSLGGYTDHVVTFGVALGSAVVVLLSALALDASWAIWGDTWQLPYVVAFWMYSFVGAMAAPPLNGVAVSAVPHASHVASALQFAMANAGKIIVPQMGGYLCSRMGLLPGFHVTVVASALLLVALAGAGTIHATKEHT